MNPPCQTAGTSSSDSVGKGLKSDGDIVITGGTFNMDCADDAVHSNQNLQISGADMKIATGDDAIHAEGEVRVNANINISTCYEGLEGSTVVVEGGDIRLVSEDDGLNAVGDNSTTRGSIEIKGGQIEALCGGDGLDSNGDVIVSGGEAHIYVQNNGAQGDQALDYDGELTVDGGILVSAGNSVGWGPNEANSQSYVFASGTFSANMAVSIRKDGAEQYSFTPSIDCAQILVSCPGMTAGQTYEVYVGDNLVSTVTSGEGGSGMRSGPGGRGGRG